MLLLASALLSTVFVSAQAQKTFPSPSIITGDGPRPPSITSPAPTGTWKPTAASYVVSGTTYAPPSETGVGKQAQIIGSDNFCIYMPPDPSTQNLVDAEAVAVAYCFNPYNDTRPMPDGFIKTSHFRQTPDYVQVSGTFDWTKMNLNPYDCGGEYDNHGSLGLGNPIGAHIDGGDNWMEFIGSCDSPGIGQFCIRSCHGANSYPYCRNTFDLMGCLWVMPGDYQEEGFTNCQADSDLPVGVYNSSYTFSQGQSYTPPPVAAPSSSLCTTVASPTASGVTYSWAQFGYATGATPTLQPTDGIVAVASSSATATGTSSTSMTSQKTSDGAVLEGVPYLLLGALAILAI